MDRRHGPWREGRPLDALLTPQAHEGPEIREIAEFALVPSRLGPPLEGHPDLGNRDAYLPSRDLDHGMLGHAVEDPELEPPSRLQEVGLIAGLSVESDRIVPGQLLQAEPLDHQPDLIRPDYPDRGQDEHHEHDHQRSAYGEFQHGYLLTPDLPRLSPLWTDKAPLPDRRHSTRTCAPEPEPLRRPVAIKPLGLIPCASRYPSGDRQPSP